MILNIIVNIGNVVKMPIMQLKTSMTQRLKTNERANHYVNALQKTHAYPGKVQLFQPIVIRLTKLQLYQ